MNLQLTLQHYEQWLLDLAFPSLITAAFGLFTARCYASVVLAMALCPSVRHKSEFY